MRWIVDAFGLFYNFFKSLVDTEVVVELKNDLVLRGKLHSVDQFLNFKLENVVVDNVAQHPQLMSVKNCFIRGSVVRYVQVSKSAVDLGLLHEATRKKAATK